MQKWFIIFFANYDLSDTVIIKVMFMLSFVNSLCIDCFHKLTTAASLQFTFGLLLLNGASA